MNESLEARLVAAAATALHKVGLTVTDIRPAKSAGIPMDRCLRIANGKVGADFIVEVRRLVGPTAVGALVTHLRHVSATTKRPALLIAEYISPPMAERLRAEKQAFVDSVGNIFLEAPGLFVYVVGQKQSRAHSANTPRNGRLLTTNGLKILFALICNPQLAAMPHRTIAVAANVALGAVPAVFAELERAGHLLVSERQRRLNATKRLLNEWAMTYAQRMYQRTVFATCIAQKFATWPKWNLDPSEARWGSEPAASLLVRHLQPGDLTIYAARVPPRLAVEQRLIPAPAYTNEGLVIFRKPFWGATLDTDARQDVVAPALIYADLLAKGDGRCIETAQILYEAHLAQLFR
jgi:hypothetical protein